MVESIPNNHETLDDYLKTIKYSYLFAKTVTLLNTNWEETNRVMLKNRRIGLSITGTTQFIASKGTSQLKTWLEKAYETARYYDDIYSEWFAIPKSKKITTAKPSGCATGDTLIPTSQGIFKLSELNQSSETWQNHSYDVFQENGKKTVSTKFYRNGVADIVKITTSNGMWLESTLNHKYRVLRGDDYTWVEAKDIKKDDILPFFMGTYDKKDEPSFSNIEYKKTASMKEINIPQKMSPEIAWVLGMYYRDGSNHKKGIRISGGTKKIESIYKAKEILDRNFGVGSIVYKDKNNIDLYLNSVLFLKFLETNELLKQKSENISVPKMIRMSSRESIEAFIDGYAHADGLTFLTVSEKWAREFPILLRVVGYDSKVRDFYSKTSIGKKKQYWISIQKSPDDVEWKFIQKKKKEVLAKLEKFGFKNCDFDFVESIEYGREETYDIEVPENNCYIANSFVSHNTLSLLAGATPGIHYPESNFYIRRVRLAKNSKYIDILKNAGYNIEPANEDPNGTLVVEFPVSVGKDVKTLNDVSIWEQLNLASFIQENWADNSVSVTVTFKENEKNQIASALDYYQFKLKAVSFLPKLENGAYKQMPYEEINEEKYLEMSSKLTPLDFSEMFSEESIGEKYCSNDSCAF